jgi:hypothetical protein
MSLLISPSSSTHNRAAPTYIWSKQVVKTNLVKFA